MEYHSGSGAFEGDPTGPPRVTDAAVLDRVAVGIYTVTPEGICTQINAAALRMLGYGEADCMGRNMHELIHYKRLDGSPYSMSECPLVKARTEEKAIYDIDEVVWSRSGQPLHVRCSAVPVRERSETTSTVVTMMDNAGTQEAEQRLRHLEFEQREVLRQRDAAARIQEELAVQQREVATIVERAAAEQIRSQQRMTEDRLVQSEKLAAVGRLAASISHEINNPLEAVTNLLYLVRNDASLSEQAEDYLRMAEQELARVSEIVAQTLRFQRASPASSACTPEALVDSVVALHQGRLHNSGIRIHRQHRRSRPFICSEGDVRQVLNNLVSNAIDAMRQSGGSITIRTQIARSCETGKEGLRITVADTGHGMTRATASQVFQPFYTTKGAAGSGLGLWISHSIARRHGGGLTVRSSTETGRNGTIFSLFLPEIAGPAQGSNDAAKPVQ